MTLPVVVVMFPGVETVPFKDLKSTLPEVMFRFSLLKTNVVPAQAVIEVVFANCPEI